MNFSFKRLGVFATHTSRWYCVCCSKKTYQCKLLVVGGGTGGCNIVWRFSRKLNPKDIILLEPSDVKYHENIQYFIHYYQPSFSLVAAGIRQLKHCYRLLSSLLPSGITWIQDRAEEFDPCDNAVYTRNGTKILYEYMVVAVGIQNDYDKIIGLKQALNDPRNTVSTIYSPSYCSKTWCNIHQFNGGHAVFTYPSTGGKCPGAILKIMFLADDYWRKHKIRYKTSISYNTANETIFGIPKYARKLVNVAAEREVVTNYCADLVEVTATGAVFKRKNQELVNIPYNILLVTPPMSPPACLRNCHPLVNEAGYLDVDKYTLQHNNFFNVFGLGDCTSTPNSKTAAATGPQSYVLERNLIDVMAGKDQKAQYNGYGACPLLTSYKKGILAEFIYDKKLWSTFPIDQAKERCIFYRMNVHLFPFLYWRYLVKGAYNGPESLRKMLNPRGRN